MRSLVLRRRPSPFTWRIEVMKLSQFFISRPIFAGVLSALIFLAGLIALPAAADQRVPGGRPADGDREGHLPRRKSQSHRGNGRESARAGDQRCGGHALPVLTGDRRWRDDPHHHVCLEHRCRQGAGAGAEPRVAGPAEAPRRRAASRCGHQQSLARSDHGRALGLSGQSLRHAVPVELCAAARQGRARSPGRRRGCAGVRRRPVLDAHLARS